MKLIIATVLLACVVLAQSHDNIFKKTWHGIKNAENSVVHKTFPKLLSYGKAGITAIRHLAIQITEDMLGVLRAEYQMARKAVGHLIHTDLFDQLVNKLIPLIDSEMTIDGCIGLCNTAGVETTDKISTSIADAACPALCTGALTKLYHAAEKLEDKLEPKKNA